MPAALDPATGRVLAELTQAGREDVEATLSSAQHGFKIWSAYTGAEKGRVLNKAARLLRDEAESLQLEAIEAHARRRLRSRIVSQQKECRHLLRRLVERGVKRRLAARTVFSNKRKWALPHSCAVEQAYRHQVMF